MKSYGDPTASSTLYVSAVGVIIFIVTVIFLEALYYSTAEEERFRKVVAQPWVELEEVRAAQWRRLESYGYDPEFNAGQGRIWIPVDEARRLLLREAQGDERVVTRAPGSSPESDPGSAGSGGDRP